MKNNEDSETHFLWQKKNSLRKSVSTVAWSGCAKGLNQIATVFNPHYDQYVNVDGYDRIARYFANEHDF